MANEFLYGSPYQQLQLPIRSPQQISGMEQLLQRGLAGSNFEPIAQEARRKYRQEGLPSLAERFGSLTGPGTRRSGGFERFAAQQESDLESQLGAMRSQYGLQQAELGLRPTFETFFAPPTQGFAAPFAGQVASGASQVGTEALGTYLNELIKQKMAPQAASAATDTAAQAAGTAAGSAAGTALAAKGLSSLPSWLGPAAGAIGIPLGIMALLYKLGAFDQVQYPYAQQGRR